MKQVRKRLTYANVMSSLAMFLVLGGATAVAAKKVRTSDIRAGAVTTNKIRGAAVTANKLRKNAVRTGKIRGGSITSDKIQNNAIGELKIQNNAIGRAKIQNGAVNGEKVADGSLSIAKLGDVTVTPLARAAATPGANKEVARGAAPALPLYSNGPLALYGKCYRDVVGSQTTAGVFVASSLPNTVASGSESPTPLVGPATAEANRVLAEITTAEDAAKGGTEPVQATASNGVAISGLVTAYAKQGNLPGGNGPFGDGDACLFTTQVIG